tara:strand:+ start:3654 stop:3944 length:291 start_codon:yes stop_codon:yes gene_type:complete
MGVWFGVAIGAGAFLLSFFGLKGLKKEAFTEGANTQHQRQQAMATMVAKEVQRKDAAIDKKTDGKIVRIRRIVKKRKKVKTGNGVNALLKRTDEWR